MARKRTAHVDFAANTQGKKPPRPHRTERRLKRDGTGKRTVGRICRDPPKTRGAGKKEASRIRRSAGARDRAGQSGPHPTRARPRLKQTGKERTHHVENHRSDTEEKATGPHPRKRAVRMDPCVTAGTRTAAGAARYGTSAGSRRCRSVFTYARSARDRRA